MVGIRYLPTSSRPFRFLKSLQLVVFWASIACDTDMCHENIILERKDVVGGVT